MASGGWPPCSVLTRLQILTHQRPGTRRRRAGPPVADRNAVNLPPCHRAPPVPVLLLRRANAVRTGHLKFRTPELNLLQIGVNNERPPSSPEQTLANWTNSAADRWLQPLYERMHTHLLAQAVLHADETPLQVLREPGRAAPTPSYLWLYRTGWDGPPIVLYEYKTTRGGEHPRAFLAGFGGYLHVDGYPGYHKLASVTLVGCWAHARRKFDEALKALPDDKQKAAVTAREGLAFCNRLFAIEREIRDATAEERLQVRREQSRLVVDAFLAWLRTQRPRVLPKSALGTAIAYCLNQWEKLEVFLQDGRLELDNNRSERSIKPFVIGHIKENGLNPFAYLTWLFEELPQLTEPKDPRALDRLLPWSESLPQACRLS